MKVKSLDFLLEPVDKNRLAYLIGPEDENLRLLEERLNLTIAYSGAHFHLEGESDHALTVCKRLLRSLYLETAPAGKSKAFSKTVAENSHPVTTDFFVDNSWKKWYDKRERGPA